MEPGDLYIDVKNSLCMCIQSSVGKDLKQARLVFLDSKPGESFEMRYFSRDPNTENQATPLNVNLLDVLKNNPDFLKKLLEFKVKEEEK